MFSIKLYAFCMKSVQYNQYFVSIVDTDDLVLKHQGISSHIAEHTSMPPQLLMG